MTRPRESEPGKARRVIITGRVQGVFFRVWTRQQAEALGLSGWVRNRFDGSVEAVFSGPAEIVDRMVEKCRQGPPHATVEGISQSAADSPPEAGFRMRASR